MKDDIEHEVLKGKREFEKIQVSIQNEVQSTIPQISDNIRRAGKVFKKQSVESIIITRPLKVMTNCLIIILSSSNQFLIEL